jgi:transcriptional regulator with XRE-family HTH domain
VDAHHKYLYKQVGALIASHRRGKLSQSSLAACLNLSRSSIANIERGEQAIQLHALFSIADALSVSPGSLLPQTANVDASTTLRDAETLQQLRSVLSGGSDK